MVSMVDRRLVVYIKEQLSYGLSRDEITSSLLGAGWPRGEIEEAFRLSQRTPGAPAETNLPFRTAWQEGAGEGREAGGERATERRQARREGGMSVGKAGFVVSLVAGIILIVVLSLNFVIYFFAPEPNPVMTYLLGGTSEVDYLKTVVWMKSPTGLVSNVILLFFVVMLLYAAIKIRKPEKHEKMGKFVIVYSVIILVVAFGSYTGIIAGVLGIIGGLLGWKGK
jgi:hypothetical protein